MTDARLDPPRSMPTYAVRAPLVRWAFVRVTPASGTTACLGMLFAMYLDLGFRRVGLGFVARPLILAEVPR